LRQDLHHSRRPLIGLTLKIYFANQVVICILLGATPKRKKNKDFVHAAELPQELKNDDANCGY
jgi:putative component of toxin-antitoxin plasmid stabilization module